MSGATPRGDFSVTAADYACRPDYPTALGDWLSEQLPTLREGRAVDVGCGPGMLTRVLAGAMRFCLAVDLEPGMLRLVRGEGAIRTARARAERLPLRDSSARLVAFAQSLHWTEAELAISEAMRVLERPGGVLVTWMTWQPSGEGAEALYSEAWRMLRIEPPARRAGHATREQAEEHLARRCGPLLRWSARVEVQFSPRELGRFFLSREETGQLGAAERERFARWVAERAAASHGSRIPYVLGAEARLARLEA